jgi:hypothetical protein
MPQKTQHSRIADQRPEESRLAELEEAIIARQRDTFKTGGKPKQKPRISASGLTPAEIMRRVPGIDRDTLHLWRKQGYIKAILSGVGRRPTYVYLNSELGRIKQMHDLVKKGYAPRRAYDYVRQQETVLAAEDPDDNRDYKGGIIITPGSGIHAETHMRATFILQPLLRKYGVPDEAIRKIMKDFDLLWTFGLSEDSKRKQADAYAKLHKDEIIRFERKE